ENLIDHRKKKELNFRVGVSTPKCSATCAHQRCDAGGALKLLNYRNAGDFCLPIAKPELFDHIPALDGFKTLEQELNERVLFSLRPSCRVHREHQKLALGDDSCQR